jgi:hypothetical protein
MAGQASEPVGLIRGMLAYGFSASASEDFATSYSFHHEFAVHAAICEVSIATANENDDQAGTSLGFLAYTFVDPDDTLNSASISPASRTPVVGHNRMISVAWFMRIYKTDAVGLFNAFFWDSVS